MLADQLSPGTALHEDVKDELASGVLLEDNSHMERVAVVWVRAIRRIESVPILVAVR